jgi:hypothetical protein
MAAGGRTSPLTTSTGYTRSRIQDPHDIGEVHWNVV